MDRHYYSLELHPSVEVGIMLRILSREGRSWEAASIQITRLAADSYIRSVICDLGIPSMEVGPAY